jgi:O-antigen/teichoic acid export membrane protein
MRETANRQPSEGVRAGVILRNIFSNWVGYVVTIGVGFFLSPFIVHRLGTTGYGVWTLVVSVTGYFGVLDLGLRQSVGRFVSRYVALNDSENVNRTLATALAMLGGAGFLAVIATVAMYFNFGVFKVEHHLETVARGALLIAGVNVSLVLPFAVFSSILLALDRFDVINAITVLGALTRAALVVLALRAGFGLIHLALVTMAVSTLEYTVMAICAKRLYPALRLRLHHVSAATARQLFGFGIYRFIWIIANQLIFYTDSVVIGLFLSTASITYYAIAGSLINYGRNIVSLASDAFYPSATRLDSKEDIAGLRNLLIAGTNVAMFIGLPICLGFLFFGRQFITLWMGKDYAVSASYLAVLTIPQFTSVAQYITALVLVGMARHKFLAQVVLIEGVANLILSVVLIRKMGLVGVAWGTAIPHLITTGFVIPMYILRTLRLSPAEYIWKGYVRPVLCAVPMAGLCYLLARWVERPSWLVFGAEVAAVVVVFGVLNYFISLTDEQREMIRGKVLSLRSGKRESRLSAASSR